jgi:hypothetical protein
MTLKQDSKRKRRHSYGTFTTKNASTAVYSSDGEDSIYRAVSQSRLVSVSDSTKVYCYDSDSEASSHEERLSTKTTSSSRVYCYESDDESML